jgi:uncharacterized membrane protein YfcA
MPTYWILVVLFLATLVQCTFGFGNALVAMPVLAFFVPLSFASPLVAMTSMTATVAIVLADWRHTEFGDTARLVAGSVFGIPLGLWLLTRADERLVKGILAMVIGSFAAYSLAQPRRFHLASDRWGYGFGWIAGILGGAYNTSGPPLVIYGSLRDWSAKQFRATLQGYFLLAGSLVLLGHALNGLWTEAVLKHYVLCLPLMAVAFVVGGFLSRRLSQERFQRTNHFVLLAIAVSLLANVLLSAPAASSG